MTDPRRADRPPTSAAVSSAPDRTEGDINLTPSRAVWQSRHDAATRDLLARDADAFVHQSLSSPCLDVLASAQGSTITTVSGRELLDFHGNSAHQVGYGHPRVVDALRRQLETLPFSPRRYTNAAAVDLAERLGSISPGGALTKVLLAPGGAEAMGIALKLARMATGRFKTISMWDAFHGASLDTISIGGEALFRTGAGPLLPGCEHVPPAVPSRCVFGCGGSCAMRCADYIGYVLEREGDVGAVIAEPIRCTTVDLPPPHYWQRVRELCDKHGALLIFDEIPIGLGRTGAMFACEHEGVVPDMLVIGKGLGGGVMPLAALLARPGLDIAKHAALGHYTHEKSPLASAAALATLDVIRDEGLVQRSRQLGMVLVDRLRDVARRCISVTDVRGRGLLVGVEIGPTHRQPDPTITAERVMYASMERGLSFKVSGGRVLTLTPPLTITEAELDRAIDILAESIDVAERS